MILRSSSRPRIFALPTLVRSRKEHRKSSARTGSILRREKVLGQFNDNSHDQDKDQDNDHDPNHDPDHVSKECVKAGMHLPGVQLEQDPPGELLISVRVAGHAERALLDIVGQFCPRLLGVHIGNQRYWS